jgi:CYTH domain-containing protein
VATEVELEKTYLARVIPEELENSRSEVISDSYLPADAVHPKIRLRHRGERYELTKKEPVDGTDSSKQNEHTIPLTQTEYESLAAVSSKKLTKRRYYHHISGRLAEVDVYQDSLNGLVVIEFEFENETEKAEFQTPDVCLADVTQEETIAAGMLAGKSYADIQPALEQYNYKPLNLGAVA